jgi:hypothetical protein
MLIVANAMAKVKKTATIFSVAVAAFVVEAVTAAATVAAAVATAVVF